MPRCLKCRSVITQREADEFDHLCRECDEWETLDGMSFDEWFDFWYPEEEEADDIG